MTDAPGKQRHLPKYQIVRNLSQKKAASPEHRHRFPFPLIYAIPFTPSSFFNPHSAIRNPQSTHPFTNSPIHPFMTHSPKHRAFDFSGTTLLSRPFH